MPPDALILANGEMPSAALVRQLAATTTLVVCADGGANSARALGLRPHAIVGDLDSIAPETRTYFADVPVHEDHDENATDLEKAVVFALARGARHIVVTGALGRRLDHTAGNLGVIAKFHDRAAIRFVDDAGELSYVGSEVRFDARPGEVVSLVPIVRCEGVVTAGLRYPLHGEVLELGLRDGTSNVVVSSPVTVRVARGHLLLYRLRPQPQAL